MTLEEVNFIRQNIKDFDTVRVGYAKNLEQSSLVRYEEIYKNNIDKDFVLTNWCGNCVFECMKRILVEFDKIGAKIELPDPVVETVVVEEPKPKTKSPSKK